MKAQWSDIRTLLEQNLPSGVFKVWISNLDGNLIEDERGKSILTLKTKNNYVATWVREKLALQITESATQCIEGEFELCIEVSELSEIQEEKQKTLTPAIHSHSISKDFIESLPSAPSVVASNGQFLLPMLLPAVSISPSEKLVKGWKHSFETFVVGPCNQLAHAAAKNMVLPKHTADMLFLCSAPGLGKTHLTQALGKAMFYESQKNNLNMAYLTAEEFTSQFVQASRFGNINDFKNRFRYLDLLLLEDIHFLRGKDKTQEELLSTIKSLQDKGCRVVFTSSFAPRELQGLDSQLTSRFCSGFVASMELPDVDTRKIMLQHKAHLRNFTMPDEVADLMAQNLEGDIRLLESSLNNLILKAELLNVPITPELALDIISQVAQSSPTLSLEDLMKLICSSFGITDEQLVSRSRRQDFVMARNTAFYLMRKHFPLTLEDIGARFNRKHSTVIKGITTVEHEMTKRSAIGSQLLHTISAIENKGLGKF